MKKKYTKEYWVTQFYKSIEADYKKVRPWYKSFDWGHIALLVIIVGMITYGIVHERQVTARFNQAITQSETKFNQAIERSHFVQAQLSDKHENLKQEKMTISEAREYLIAENERLQNRVTELEAITNSKSDIKNYILTYYKTVPPAVAEQIAHYLFEKTAEHDVPLVAAVAVTQIESHFNPYAVSTKYARGLMQVMYKVWGKSLGLTSKYQLHDIETNIDCGVRILRIYLDQTNNNMKKALYKYVGGDSKYGKAVYEAMGQYVMYRSFAQLNESNGKDKEEIAKEAINPPFIHTIKYRQMVYR
jgi:hypothetical protein